MTVISTESLPPAPADRRGWPWEVDSDGACAGALRDTEWPRITVVTPSLNQAEFLEETLRSVLLQGYPNLEYIVVDGGSTDGSVDIIRKYDRWLAWWVSERDSGQVEAIEKGIGSATGEIVNWINSDDVLEARALVTVASLFGPHIDAVAGACLNTRIDRTDVVLTNSKLTPRALIRGRSGMVFQQPAFWIRRDQLGRCGGLDKRLHYFFDMEMAIRYLASSPRVAYVDRVLARFRLHERSKSVAESNRFLEEYEVALANLAENPAFFQLRRTCSLRLGELERHHQVAELLRDDATPRTMRCLRLLGSAVSSPRPGLLAINAAALLRLLKGRRWFLDDLESPPGS